MTNNKTKQKTSLRSRFAYICMFSISNSAIESKKSNSTQNESKGGFEISKDLSLFTKGDCIVGCDILLWWLLSTVAVQLVSACRRSKDRRQSRAVVRLVRSVARLDSRHGDTDSLHSIHRYRWRSIEK